MFLQPASLTFGDCGVSQLTQLTVRQVEGLQGFAFQLYFDPAVIEVVDADASQSGIQITLGDSIRNSQHFVATNQVDPEQGIIEFAAVVMGSQAIASEGMLAQIEWRPRQTGNSSLRLEQVELADSNGRPIQLVINHSSVAVNQPCS
jgi:hypothetical protein